MDLNEFEGKTLGELTELQRALAEAKRSAVESAKQKMEDAKSTIAALAENIGLEPRQLVSKLFPAVRGPREPKYRDPGSDKTWCGIGKVPGWMSQLEEQGHSRDEFLIENDSKKKSKNKGPLSD